MRRSAWNARASNGGSVPLRADIKGTELPPANIQYIDTTWKAIDCTTNLANLQSLEWDLLLMDCLFKNYLEMAAFMLTKIANVILELNAQSFN